MHLFYQNIYEFQEIKHFNFYFKFIPFNYSNYRNKKDILLIIHFTMVIITQSCKIEHKKTLNSWPLNNTKWEKEIEKLKKEKELLDHMVIQEKESQV